MTDERSARGPLSDQPAPKARVNGHADASIGAGAVPKSASAANAANEKSLQDETLASLLKQLQELKAYVAYYASAKADQLRASLQAAIDRAATEAMKLVALGGFAAVASWFVLSGMSTGLGTLFGQHAWLGSLLTGLAAITAAVTGIACVSALRRGRARRGLVEKYESRHSDQRERFGRDAQSRSGVESRDAK